MKGALFGVAGMLVAAGSASADYVAHPVPVTVTNMFDDGSVALGGALYTSNTETGFRYNGGAGMQVLDDVPIPDSRLGGFTRIDVTKITYGIRRIANAPAVDVTGLYAKVVPGSQQTDIGDTINTIGTVGLPANGAASVTTLVSFGDGTNTLFSVDLRMADYLAGFGTFAAGVSLSESASTLNGFRITSGPDANVDAFWHVDPNTGVENYFFFGGAPLAFFYVVVEGRGVVPAPGVLAPLALAGLVAARRRR